MIVYKGTDKDMFGVNQAIIVTRIAEMKEISIDEIKNALEESKSSKGKELYYIMCAQPMQPVVECTEAELQAYCRYRSGYAEHCEVR